MAAKSGKNTKKRAPATDLKKPKRNQLQALGVTRVDYKDVQLLRTFISERGKIRSRRVTGLTPQQQRQVAAAIKNAREMALLPAAGPR
ncbi:30S ribosomal protein S18 [Mycobacterium sp. 852013-50091_SCH5140682]|uniref:30S ribosomal protein S18 n=1 Tax=Mycobacterium sp. 852013-50091_SCH5140682 TaxID=1834109 RepID=UPI0007E9E33B|nr:30S ribosomal protein S18 [Mycobacterium sp. 852013-50091_SCH5140682]OBC04505.1 30S ribosomal protein S18 [Mycobacterium sp. 852013-50091_SCH5140682]